MILLEDVQEDAGVANASYIGHVETKAINIHSNLGNKIIAFKIVRAQIYPKIR